MNVLFSVHPKFATAIQEERKDIELRKTNIKGWNPGDIAFFYATSPIKRVVCAATQGDHYTSPSWWLVTLPEYLKRICVSEEQAIHYLHKVYEAHLYELKTPVGFCEPVKIENPPQSFRYLTKDESVLLIYKLYGVPHE